MKKVILQALVAAIGLSAQASEVNLAQLMAKTNKTLSAEEQIKEIFDQSIGKIPKLSDYRCLVGLGMSNSFYYDSPNHKFKQAQLLVVNSAPVVARDIILQESFVTAAARTYVEEYRGEDSLYSCHAINNARRTSPETQTHGVKLEVREFREVEPGVLVSMIRAQTKDGFPGYCEGFRPDIKSTLVTPAKKNRRGEIVKDAVYKDEQVGWNGGRKDWSLPDVCELQLLWVRK